MKKSKQNSKKKLPEPQTGRGNEARSWMVYVLFIITWQEKKVDKKKLTYEKQCI